MGAGDAFQAGLLEGLAAAGQLSRDGLEILPEAALRQAIVTGALTCQRAGADLPRRDEVAAALA